MLQKLAAYLPVVFAVFSGIIFLAFPALAAVLLGLVCFAFAFLYGTVVYRLGRFFVPRNEATAWRPDGADTSFKNVSYHIVRLGSSWRAPYIH